MKILPGRGRFFVLKAGLFVLSFILANGLTSGVRAQDNLASLRAFWSNKLPSTTELKNDYNNLSTKPFGREDLAFSLLIPRDWKDTPVTVNKEQLKNDSVNWILLTTQLSPEEKNEASIQVAFVRLDLEMGLSDYLDQHSEANNYKTLLRRHGVYNNREIEETLALSTDQIARITFSRHGDRIFAVVCSCPESEYQRYASSFAAAAISFTLKKEPPQPFSSVPMTTFSSAKAPRYEFRYPEYWEVEEVRGQPPGKSGVEIRMTAPDEKGQTMTYGYIFVQGYDKSTGKTPSGILNEIRKTLEAKPLTFEEKILSANLASGTDDLLLKLQRFRAAVKGVPAEVATLVVGRGSDLLAVSLVAPPRDTNLLAWMHCWKIFEIVAGDLAGKELPILHVKNLILPSEKQLASLAMDTMESFSRAVKDNDFTQFFNNTSNLLQVQSSPGHLRSAFSGFSRQPEIPLLPQHGPVVLTKDGLIDEEGLLAVEGYLPTKPQATTFQLTYLYEKPRWKLLGINVAMRDDPAKGQ